MKLVTIYDHLEQKEITVDAHDIMGFKLGDLVRHKNEGKSAGSHGIIKEGQGIVQDISYQGEYSWGGHCWTAEVKWESGRTYTLTLSLLDKEAV